MDNKKRFLSFKDEISIRIKWNLQEILYSNTLFLHEKISNCKGEIFEYSGSNQENAVIY